MHARWRHQGTLHQSHSRPWPCHIDSTPHRGRPSCLHHPHAKRQGSAPSPPAPHTSIDTHPHPWLMIPHHVWLSRLKYRNYDILFYCTNRLEAYPSSRLHYSKSKSEKCIDSTFKPAQPHIMSYHIIPYHTLPYHAMSCETITYHIMSYITPYNVIP